MCFAEGERLLAGIRRCAALALWLCFPVILGGQDLLSSQLPEQVAAGAEPLQRISLSPDGSAGILLARGQTIRVVEMASGKSLRQFGPFQGRVTALALEGAAGVALVATERAIWSVSAASGEAPRKLWESEAIIQELSLSPDLDLLAVATSQGARVLNPRTGALHWSAPGAACTTIRFAPVGATLAMGIGATVEIRQVPGFALKQTWALDHPVTALAYAPDARTMAVAGGRDSLLLKRIEDGHTLRFLTADCAGQVVAHIAFGSGSAGLFAASGRKLLVFSELDQSLPNSQTIAVEAPILSVAFAKGAGALFATTEGGKALARWSVAPPARSLPGSRPGLPAITILSPEPGARVLSETVDLTFQLSFPAERPVTGIRILSGGRPARIAFASGSGSPPATYEGAFTHPFQAGRVYSCQVRLPDRETTLLVVADGPAGSSDPVLLALQRNQAKSPKGDAKVVPPGLTLLSPGPKALLLSPALTVAVKVNAAPGQPVTLVRLLLDGVPVPLRKVTLASGAPFDSSVGWVSGETYRFPIQVPDWDCTLTVLAESAFATSAPVTARLQWRAQSGALDKQSKSAQGEPASAKGIVGTDAAQVKASAEGASRILEGGPQGGALQMEVDAKGRIRWRDPAAGSPKKTTQHGKAAPGVAAAPKAASAMMPSLQIVAPSDGSRFKEKELLVSVKVGAPAGKEVTRVLVFVDGTPVEVALQTTEGAPINPPYPGGQPLKVRIPVPLKDCQVSMQAENAAGPGKPVVLKLKYEGDPVAASSGRSIAQQSVIKPRIAIFEPRPNSLVRSNVVQLGIQVSLDPRQPPASIRILVDAQEVKAARVVPQKSTPEVPAGPQPTGSRAATEEIQYYTVALPPKDCTVMAYAETPYATSDPSLVKLRWDSPNQAAPPAGLPTLYLLSVGVSKYKEKNIALTYPAKDAKDFAEAMKLQAGKLYKDVVVRVRTDELATRDNIMDDLEWIQRQATQRDMVIVFFAGHGINDAVTGNYYYLPWDANIEAVKRTMIPGSEIHSTLARLTGTRLLFMDTCHAGNVTGTAMRAVPDLRQFLQDLKEGGQGLVVITSSRPGQKSQEHPSWNNGAFTKALVEGLKGRAMRDRQGFITFTALDAYITQRVKELTKGTQAPATQKSTEVSDFPLAFAEL